MSISQPELAATEDNPLVGSALEPSILGWGDKLFSLIDSAETPTLFSKKGLYGALMEWAMRDEQFKIQLFRFVDVLPTLTRRRKFQNTSTNTWGMIG